MPFVMLLLLFGTCYLILSGLLLLCLPLNVLSKLTISSLTFTCSSTSRPHQRLRFYFRHWRSINLYCYYYYYYYYNGKKGLFLFFEKMVEEF